MLTTVTCASWPQRYNAFKKAKQLFQVKIDFQIKLVIKYLKT